MAETLPAALEPELRRIIDTAVARVAAIELEAIHEARELTQRSEKEAREALRFALDRAFNLIATLELLASTVSGMADALKIELDDAIDALRKVPEPESELAKELAQRRARTGGARRRSRSRSRCLRRSRHARAGACRCPAAAARSSRRRRRSPQRSQPPPWRSLLPWQEPARRSLLPRRWPPAAARGNGYPPAERQAESLAAATRASRSRSPSRSRPPSAR